MPPLMTWRVVSSPPTRSSSVSNTISSSVRRSPSTSAWVSTLTRSSVGSSRRAATMARAYASYSMKPVAAASICSGVPPSEPSIASDHWRSRARSDGGTPSMSPITIIGSGAARSCTTSHVTRLADAVDELVAERAQVRRGVLHPCGREAAAHELAPLVVVGRVEVDHPRHRTGVRTAAARARVRRGVASGGAHALVRRDPPQVVALVEVDGFVLAHPLVRAPGRVAVEVAGQQVERGCHRALRST